MKNINSNQRLPFGKLTAAFVLATLANESLHFHETHSPHGNRTERYAEMRARCTEARQQDRSTLRRLNSGGGDPDPDAVPRIEAPGRRRIMAADLRALPQLG